MVVWGRGKEGLGREGGRVWDCGGDVGGCVVDEIFDLL